MRLVIVVLLVCLAFGAFAKVSFLKVEILQRKTVEECIQNFRAQNLYFNTLYEQLDSAKRMYFVCLGKSEHLAYFQVTKSGGEIHFSNLQMLADENAVQEEFFHAYQHLFYNLPSPLLSGGSNIEYEAKLYKALVAVLRGLPMNETPSQKGLLNLAISLFDKQGNFSLQNITEKFQIEYLSCVLHFQQHWLRRNRAEGKDNIYAQEVQPTWLPNAAFHLLTLPK